MSRVVVDPVTRIEGHSKITIHLKRALRGALSAARTGSSFSSAGSLTSKSAK